MAEPQRLDFKPQSRELAYGSLRTLGDRASDVDEIAEALVATRSDVVLLRHVSVAQARLVARRHPAVEHFPRSGVLVLRAMAPDIHGTVTIVSAGTADRPVAEEAEATTRALGSRTSVIADVGVAGLHRVLRREREIQEAECLIVAAGMDGALPGLIARIASCPVVALPTSVGYGASFGGLAAFCAMASADAPGMAVVGIDDGVAAGAFAARVVRRAAIQPRVP